MEIDKKFNTLTFKEYFFYIDNHKKYIDFNTLGLYRSIGENTNLSLEEKIAIREYAHQRFRKTFEFLQLKDPQVFVEVSTLGQELTKGDEEKIWRDIKQTQQKILADKRIKHRNFGVYSKHHCGYNDCVYSGLMIRQGSSLAESGMHFAGDKNKFQQEVKSARRKSERKQAQRIIHKELGHNS